MENNKRLIDANELLDFVKRLKFEGGTKTRTQAGQEVLDIHIPQIVAKIRTVDAVEVVHGWWRKGGYACGETEWQCSVCNETEWRTSIDRLKYCPFCGAKMDLKEMPDLPKEDA